MRQDYFIEGESSEDRKKRWDREDEEQRQEWREQSARHTKAIFGKRWWLTPIIIGVSIGIALNVSWYLFDKTTWEAYSARHHCVEQSKQIDWSAMNPEKTVYVCDGGKVAIH